MPGETLGKSLEEYTAAELDDLLRVRRRAQRCTPDLVAAYGTGAHAT